MHDVLSTVTVSVLPPGIAQSHFHDFTTVANEVFRYNANLLGWITELLD